ncbi:Iron-sulfur cluster assembly accessory protein [Aphelenchoides fujianensis]|nr:Iron-sulfur cluster assembly accessory protein [Aphelenchoides fujianensis]
MVFDELQAKGWQVDENALSVELDLADESERLDDVNKLEEFLLNSDLHDVAVPALVNQLDRKSGLLTGPIVLQLAKWRNVSHSEISNHDKNDGICALGLTDGHSAVRAVQMAPLSGIDGTTPYGTKLLLSGRIRCENGHLLLDNKNTKKLGGLVPDIVEKWRTERFRGERGKGLVEAPKWIPFSKAKNVNLKMDRNFSAMKAAGNPGEESKEEDEKTAQFKAERRARIEALDVAAAPEDVEEEVVEGVRNVRIEEEVRAQGRNDHQPPKSRPNDRRDHPPSASARPSTRGSGRPSQPRGEGGGHRGDDRGPPRSAGGSGRPPPNFDRPPSNRPPRTEGHSSSAFESNRGAPRGSRGGEPRGRGGGRGGGGRGGDRGSSRGRGEGLRRGQNARPSAPFGNPSRQQGPPAAARPAAPMFNLNADFPSL